MRKFALTFAIAVWAGMSLGAGPETDVRRVNGRATLFIEGKPFMSPLFATYVPQYEYYQEMADAAGCQVFNFQTNCSQCDIPFSAMVWKGPDEWDFREMDQRAAAILEADPDGLILPRIYVGTPKWWRELHPDEMIVLDHGGKRYRQPYNTAAVRDRMYPSLASQTWRRDMARALRKTVEHIENSAWGKHVMGYQLGGLGSEEWYYNGVNQEQLGDYSVHARQAFGRWLRAKYGTVDALRRAWGREDVDFDNVSIPTPGERKGSRARTFYHPATEMNVIDFYEFYNDLIPQVLDQFGGVIKEVTAGRKVVGAFYWYFLEFWGNPEFGHNGGHTILRSRNLDFIMQSPCWFQRELITGADYYRRPFLSAHLNGKVIYYDNDTPSYLWPTLPRVTAGHTPAQIAFYRKAMAVAPTATESIWTFQRTAGMVLAEGIYESYFDLHGGYFSEPRLLSALARIRRMLERSTGYDKGSAAQILVVTDELSQNYTTFFTDWAPPGYPKPAPKLGETLREFQRGFVRCGAPFDAVLLTDIDQVDADSYRLIVFVNTWNLGERHREQIRAKFQRPGKTLLWCYAPGYFQDHEVGMELMRAATGFDIVAAEDERYVAPRIALNEAAVTRLGVEAGSVIGFDQPIGKMFYVDDAEAVTLGALPGTDHATLAYKQVNGAESFYSITAILPPSFVRTLARAAGVHIYNEHDETLYANRNYITLNAAFAGTRRLSLPVKADVYNALTQEKYFAEVTGFDVSLMAGETAIFRYAPCE